MITFGQWYSKQKMIIFWRSSIHQELDFVSSLHFLVKISLLNKSFEKQFIFTPTQIESKSKEAIRNASGLNRFIYIACSPKAALRNWTDFSRPCSKSLKGDPFILKEAAGIDMFPHTDHVEMVLLFERVIDEKPQPTTSSS